MEAFSLLAALTPKQREAWVDLEICDCSVDEVAESMGVSRGTVFALRNQARYAIERELACQRGERKRKRSRADRS